MAHFEEAAPGLTIGTFQDAPPWIVVDISLATIIVASWPGRLWEIQVVHRASEQPAADAGYVRATAVHVVRELSPAILFGANGEAVASILSVAAQLTLVQRDQLARLHSEAGDEAYSQVWNRWLVESDPTSDHCGDDHRNTLAVVSGKRRSPLGAAPTVLHSVLSRRATEVDGAAAFVEDGEERYFSPAWSKAFASLLHACFAMGAEASLVSKDQRSTLIAAYESLAGIE
ncbi:hypothetical protein [Jeongeupia naejangsanensis]|uniref:Uncharacterized protein n=1 Tax=Jeongeupia naejangsanensis TaxID=613195 RepID=A0ABS2BKE0_9NEIS|nr:hypothetical protein [Jeongeupia naejangsanensis]MBM3116082.1 hypothetical protein [Jeongeupia naejangsanensis]